jgi:ubiquitin C-terminal hydrolase
MNFGHYTGHVYSEKDEKWFYADDSSVTEDGVGRDAPELYLLFYAKK